MSLVKVATGKIFEDNFSNGFNALWDIFPFSYNNVHINENSITLLPGEYIEMLLHTPSVEFEMYVEIAYISEKEGDEAGILMKSTTGHVIENKISYNSSEENKVKYMKLRRNNNYNVYASGSEDGVKWKNYGCTHFYDGHSVGFFNDSYLSNLEIKKVVICKSNYVIINGISNEDTITLYNEELEDLISSHVVDINRSNGRITLDLTNCKMPLKNCEIIINEMSDEPTSLFVSEMYGGDAFDFTPDMYFTIEDTYGDIVSDYDLGTINHTEKIYTVTLFNKSDDTKHGSIIVEPVSTYDKGDSMVFLHTLGSDLSYPSKSIPCAILPESSFKCILQIKKDPNIATIDDRFNFRLMFV